MPARPSWRRPTTSSRSSSPPPSEAHLTPLRRLLVAQTPADFADWLDYVVVAALLTYQWEVGYAVFALFAVCLGLPYLLIGPIAGAAVDRLPLRAVLIGSNLGRALATAALVLAPGWEVLLALVFLRGAVDAFFTPAKQAALQLLAPPAERMRANGISHAINQASKIVAPALGGALLLLMPARGVFLLNACVSLAAALLLWPLPALPRPRQAGETFLDSLSGGWHEIRTKRRLGAAVLLTTAGTAAMFLYDTLFAPLTRAFGLPQSAFGWAMASVGAGGVIGALVLGRFDAGPKARFRIIAAGAALSALWSLSMGLFEITGTPLPLAPYLGALVVTGIATAMVVVPLRAVMQDETDPARMARVAALTEALTTPVLVVAPFVGAGLAAITTLGAAFVAGGIGTATVGWLALRLDRRLTAPEPEPLQP